MRRLQLIVLFLACLGCGTSEPEPSSTETAPRKAQRDVAAVAGPGGTVSLGDDVPKAKAAFPAPASSALTTADMVPAAAQKLQAEVYWGWAGKDTFESFMVLATADKVTWLMYQTAEGARELLDASKEQGGEPDRHAVGEKAMIYVWSEGEVSRHLLMTDIEGVGNMAILTIGKTEDLRKLDPAFDDLDAQAKRFSESAEEIARLKREAVRK